MADLITVQGTNKEHKVVIWETHPLHITKENPTGEIFISGEEVATVGKTNAVKRLLQSGALVETTGKTVVALSIPTATPPPAEPRNRRTLSEA